MGSSGKFVKNDRRRGQRNGTGARYRHDEHANWLRLVDWRPIPTHICAVVHDQAIESDGSVSAPTTPMVVNCSASIHTIAGRWIRAPLDPAQLPRLRYAMTKRGGRSHQPPRHSRKQRIDTFDWARRRREIFRRRPQATARQRGRGPTRASRAPRSVRERIPRSRENFRWPPEPSA